MATSCTTKGCGRPPAPASANGFCVVCAENLARIREAMEADARKHARPTCLATGCSARVPRGQGTQGVLYCAAHELEMVAA